jgi:hypothetical protein
VSDESCVAYGGYIYCVGGYNSATDSINKVYYAPVSNGNVGSWASARNNYPRPLAGLSCVAYGGYIYCMDGYELNGSTAAAISYVAQSALPTSVPDTTTQWVAQNPNFDYALGWLSCTFTLEQSTLLPQIMCAGGDPPSGYSTQATYLAAIISGNPPFLSSWSHYSNYPEGVQAMSCVTNNNLDPTCIGGIDISTGEGYNDVFTCTTSTCTSSDWQTSYWTQAAGSYTYPDYAVYMSCPVDSSSGYVYCIGGAKAVENSDVIHSISNPGAVGVPWN